jgi:hypothetical protein
VRVVLQRAAKLFAGFVVLVAATIGLASLANPGFANPALYRVLALLIAPVLVVHRWIYGQPDREEPILDVYVIMGVETLVALLLLYFVVCLALAWCWTWIKARTANT